MPKKPALAPSDPHFHPDDFNKVPTDVEAVRALLIQHTASAKIPEADLVPLFYQYEHTQPEVAKYLDDAIELLSKARAAMAYARLRLK